MSVYRNKNEMTYINITGGYDHLELMDTETILRSMNNEDKTVPLAVEKVSMHI